MQSVQPDSRVLEACPTARTAGTELSEGPEVMAWIESHQALGAHPKTIALAEHLHCSMPTAVGHLQYLWWWALDFAPSGQIRTTPPVIAHACYWRGNAQHFWQSLILAGFMDVDEDTVTIHDWFDYAGKLIEQRALRRESNKQAQSARRQ